MISSSGLSPHFCSIHLTNQPSCPFIYNRQATTKRTTTMLRHLYREDRIHLPFEDALVFPEQEFFTAGDLTVKVSDIHWGPLAEGIEKALVDEESLRPIQAGRPACYCHCGQDLFFSLAFVHVSGSLVCILPYSPRQKEHSRHWSWKDVWGEEEWG